MRTTIEIKREHRARLLELAARRGEKGFSRLIEDALEAYLDAQAAADGEREKAIRLRGTLAADDAEELRTSARTLRKTWR